VLAGVVNIATAAVDCMNLEYSLIVLKTRKDFYIRLCSFQVFTQCTVQFMRVLEFL
jgi:hypothetical protein